MSAFRIYQNSENKVKAVKDGFSWPAFFFSIFWLFVRGLYLYGFILVIATLIIAFLIPIIFTKITEQYFSFILNLFGIGMSIFLGIIGNRLQVNLLEKKGYKIVMNTLAHDSWQALKIFYNIGNTSS